MTPIRAVASGLAFSAIVLTLASPAIAAPANVPNKPPVAPGWNTDCVVLEDSRQVCVTSVRGGNLVTTSSGTDVAVENVRAKVVIRDANGQILAKCTETVHSMSVLVVDEIVAERLAEEACDIPL
jgi:hypothetical protein